MSQGQGQGHGGGPRGHPGLHGHSVLSSNYGTSAPAPSSAGGGTTFDGFDFNSMMDSPVGPSHSHLPVLDSRSGLLPSVSLGASHHKIPMPSPLNWHARFPSPFQPAARPPTHPSLLPPPACPRCGTYLVSPAPRKSSHRVSSIPIHIPLSFKSPLPQSPSRGEHRPVAASRARSITRPDSFPARGHRY